MKKLLSILLISASSLTFAKEQIKIIVPFAPGGQTDVTARVYAKELSKQDIDAVVINRPGADGKVAVTEFLNAKPDGKTIMLGSNGSVVYPGLESQEYYENSKKLVPLMQTSVMGQIALTKKDGPLKTWDDVVARLKSGKTVSIGVPSPVTRSLAKDLFGDNPNVILVPFNGDAPTVMALHSNTIDIAFATFLYGPKVVAGELNGLAVSTDFGVFGIKSFKEQGINAVRDQWAGFFAPPGTTDEQTKKLYDMLEKARKSPELQDLIRNQLFAVVARSRTPAEFADLIEKDYRRLLKLMK